MLSNLSWFASSALIVSLAIGGCSKDHGFLAANKSGLGIQGGALADYGAPIASTVVGIIRYSLRTSELSFQCTGVVIAENLILTAGHCLSDKTNESAEATDRYIIYFGAGGVFHNITLNLEKDSFEEESSFRVASEFRVHPQFVGARDGGQLDNAPANDIALLRIPNIPSYAHVASIISDASIIKPTANIKTYGFGLRDSDIAAKSIFLRVLDSKIIDRDESRRQTVLATNRDNMLIPGDSGGPSFIETKDGTRLWGVSSTSTELNNKTKGMTFAECENILPHADWIKAVTAEFDAAK